MPGAYRRDKRRFCLNAQFHARRGYRVDIRVNALRGEICAYLVRVGTVFVRRTDCPATRIGQHVPGRAARYVAFGKRPRVRVVVERAELYRVKRICVQHDGFGLHAFGRGSGRGVRRLHIAARHAPGGIRARGGYDYYKQDIWRARMAASAVSAFHWTGHLRILLLKSYERNKSK